MKNLPIWGATLAAVLCAGPLQSADPEEAMGLERGKYGDPNALVTVGFTFGTADLTPTSRGMLEDFAGQMDQAARIEIGGHTDSVGDKEYNQWLSEQRATTVRKYLVNQGVNAEQLTAVGYGETQPIDSNRSRLGRAHNRRVVLKPQR